MAKKSFSIAAVLKGVDNSGPILRGLGHVRTAGMATGRALKGALSLGGKVLSLGGLLGGVSLVGAGIALKKFTSDYSKTTDEAAKFSRQVHIGLGALQEWEYVAGRQGVSTETLRKSLETLSVTLGQIRTRSGRAYKFLASQRDLRPLMDSLSKARDSDEALTILLSTLNRIPDSGKRAYLATKLLGGEGARLLRISEAGADGIAKLRGEAVRFGVSSDLAGKQAEDYRDSVARMDAALMGLKRTVGESLMPVAIKYTDMLTGWIGDNRELIGVKVAEWVDRGARALDGLIANGPNIINTLESIGEAAGTVAGAINDAATALGYFTGATQDKIESEYINITPNPGERQRALGKIESSRNQWIKDYRDEFGSLPQGWAVPSKFRPGTPEFHREMDRLVLDERSGSKDVRRLTTLDEVLSGQSVPGAEPQQSYMPGAIQTPVLAGIRGKAKIDIRVSDDRVRVRSVDTTGDGLDVTADVGERSDLSDEGDW